MLAILLSIWMGFGVAMQTVINTRLRMIIGSPLLAATISFAVGTAVLALLLLVQGQEVFPQIAIFQQTPWWFWIGGLLGGAWVTFNIIVFSKLGAVQAAILPILGQLIAAALIDLYGLFGIEAQDFSLIRIVGLFVVFVGMCLAVAGPVIRQFLQREAIAHKTSLLDWFWRLLGVSSGLMIAIQSAVNTQLSIALASKVQAAFVSFGVGSIGLLIVFILIDRRFGVIKHTIGKPLWIWLGGALGAGFVTIGVIVIPWIGIGQVFTLMLLGLLIGSLCVDSFGWFGVPKKRITQTQFSGLVLLFIGVVLVRLF